MATTQREPTAGGGWQAIRYCLNAARAAGGFFRLYRALRSKNACKTCALGMGGQRGGMVNEAGSFPEVCKKSVQAMAADMQPAIPESFWREHSVAELQSWSPRELESAGRLVQPLRLAPEATHYEPISWHEAYRRTTQGFRGADPSRTFFYFSGRSSNEAAFLLQLFARVYGSNHVNNCSYYCHQASGVGLTSVTGSGTATIVWDDLYACDLVFLIGGNPASNHPRLITALADVRRRGGDVIVVNPVRELGLERFKIPSRPLSLLWGSPIASQFIQVDVGGDLAWLWGMAKRLSELGALDQEFLNSHCSGTEAYLEALERLTWEEVTAESGVDFDTIDKAARRYADSRRTIFAWTMGITHHEHGVANVQAIANLALARGMVGRRGAGLLPIRGHSNVQGVGSVGAVPRLKPAMAEALHQRLGIELPAHEGMDTLACMEAANRKEIDAALCLGGNLYGSNPDAHFASRALGRIPLVVYLNTTLNTGHLHGCGRETLILPVLARDEEPYRTTQESMFNYVRISDGGASRHIGPQSELHVIARLARGILGEEARVDWGRLSEPGELRRWIAEVVPGYRKIGSVDQSLQEFQIDGRTFHVPQFNTPDGRARLHVHTLPVRKRTPGHWRLMTVRSEGQFNTVVYEEGDLYRGQERRDVVLLHPSDIERAGWQADQPVIVESDAGSLKVLARPFERIKPGNALMYFPEANVLVPRRADPESRTPAFKGIDVAIRAANASTGG